MADRYTVTGQRPSSRVTPAGQIERTYEVSFITKPNGIAGVAEIPLGQYTPDKVDSIIGPLAANLETVNNL